MRPGVGRPQRVSVAVDAFRREQFVRELHVTVNQHH